MMGRAADFDYCDDFDDFEGLLFQSYQVSS